MDFRWIFDGFKNFRSEHDGQGRWLVLKNDKNNFLIKLLWKLFCFWDHQWGLTSAKLHQEKDPFLSFIVKNCILWQSQKNLAQLDFLSLLFNQLWWYFVCFFFCMLNDIAWNINEISVLCTPLPNMPMIITFKTCKKLLSCIR